MKQIANTQILDLNPNDFKGLEGHSRQLQEKVRQVSTINLFEPTAMHDIELEIHISKTNSAHTKLFLVFFGKDEVMNGKTEWRCSIEPRDLTKKTEFLTPLNNWSELTNEDSLIVERIGFFSYDKISFTAVVKATELIGDNGFLDL